MERVKEYDMPDSITLEDKLVYYVGDPWGHYPGYYVRIMMPNGVAKQVLLAEEDTPEFDAIKEQLGPL